MAHPTTGGLLASFASLGDVLLAEPGALMSFAGPRVVAQTTRAKLPDDFGLAESNLRFGHVDAIVPRPSCGRRWPASSVSSERSRVARDAEIRLRDRLSKLGGLDLLRGARLSGELERSSASSTGSRPSRPTKRSGRRSISPVTRTGRTRSTTSSESWTTGSSCTATAGGPTTRRSSRGSGSSRIGPSR